MLPLLEYARGRGLWTQLNTNLTYPLERYLPLLGLVDIWHTTWNYRSAVDFHRIAFAHGRESVNPAAATRLYQRILANMADLAARGEFVSAETMMTAETLTALADLNRVLAGCGCRRHEIHPRYPVDFARHLALLDLDTLRAGLARFLADRDPDLWALLGTFPFFLCSPDARDRELVRQVRQSANVTIRNDPDGRCRLNVSSLTGDVLVTDFADFPPLGNIGGGDLNEMFARWQTHPAAAPYGCSCPEAHCLGPCPLVAAAYYPDVDFRRRRARVD